MRTKKVRKSRQTFRSVGIRVDGHVSDMRDPSVMSLVYYVRISIGIRADGHVSDMHGPLVMSSVFNVGNAVSNSADGHVRQPVGDSVGISVGKAVGNPSVNVAKSRNFFATLCEIPTGYIPSVYPSVKR